MDDQALMLLMSSIMLLAKMMQDSIVDVDPISFTFFELDNNIVNTLQALESKYTLLFIALHEYRILFGLSVLFDDLGDWVKPKSTTWFSRFLLTKFDENHWVENFILIKATLFCIVEKLQFLLLKQDTQYTKTIPIEIQVYCSIYN
jgi:hypothetical protein